MLQLYHIIHNVTPILKKCQFVKDILSFWGTFWVYLVKSAAVMSHNTQCDPNFKKNISMLKIFYHLGVRFGCV